MTTVWTREEIEKLLQRESFTYQRIELPFGLTTEGADRSATAQAIFPPDLTGKSILDLGCNNGFFCFEAAKRGAATVVGLDVEPEMIRKNRILADVLGLNVRFEVLDLDRRRLTEQFDYVLCLNVLHHLRYPLYVLDNLSEIARERLILEMASFGWQDSIRMGNLPLLSPILSRLPVIFVSPGHHEKKLKRFIITPPAITNLLMTHRRVYASCKITPSEHKGRYLVNAEKYRIGHLVVVAGPTGANLQSLAESLTGGEPSPVSSMIAMERGKAIVLSDGADAKIDTAIMTYDILNPFLRTGNVYSRDVPLDIIAAADRVSFVTLKPPAAELALAFGGRLKRRSILRRPSKRDRRILESYASEESLSQHFRNWLEYVEGTGRNSVVVDRTGGERVMSGKEFMGQLHS